MSWKNLVHRRQVVHHQTSRKEISELRNLIARDLADSAVSGLSSDRRFATAYNAVLQIAKMAIAYDGYRVPSGIGHHQNTFEAARQALGRPSNHFLDYFDLCRRKRNQIDYMRSAVVTENEAHELLSQAKKFYELVESWMASRHGGPSALPMP